MVNKQFGKQVFFVIGIKKFGSFCWIIKIQTQVNRCDLKHILDILKTSFTSFRSLNLKKKIDFTKRLQRATDCWKKLFTQSRSNFAYCSYIKTSKFQKNKFFPNNYLQAKKIELFSLAFKNFRKESLLFFVNFKSTQNNNYSIQNFKVSKKLAILPHNSTLQNPKKKKVYQNIKKQEYQLTVHNKITYYFAKLEGALIR
eukprot:TRINITY_DN778_c0_g5_i1.p1 TRINITY_DN778_c0_g5~~TRINITY_DN778_c0_g5_i1.p1  ORF type:complete len:199 (+),score=4.72 TRINITY_DN778_c0_g5_i1:210-806(+)